MKPSFALNLSHDGISLLHRAQAGWLSVGDVSLDAPDLVDELVVLRRTATDLEAEGLTTKLVIPNSQILYMEIDAPGPGRAERLAQIREALVGMTPYDVNDLIFDWKMKKGKAQVAAVTRETLTEAETFATQYRFNPVSFVAIPQKGDFDGEPFFGPTRHALNILPGGESVEPDKRRIEILGRLGEVLEPVEETAVPASKRRAKAVAEAEPEATPVDTVAADESPAEDVTLPGGDEPLLAHYDTKAPDEVPGEDHADDAGADPATPDAGPAGDEPGVSAEAAEQDASHQGADAAAEDATAEEPTEAPVLFSSRRGVSMAKVNGHAVPPLKPAAEPEEPPRAAEGPQIADLPPVEPATPALRRPEPKPQPNPEPKPEPRNTVGFPPMPPRGTAPEAAAPTAPSVASPETPGGKAVEDKPVSAPTSFAPSATGLPESAPRATPPMGRAVMPPAAPVGASPAARAALVDPSSPELAKKADPVLDAPRPAAKLPETEGPEAKGPGPKGRGTKAAEKTPGGRRFGLPKLKADKPAAPAGDAAGTGEPLAAPAEATLPKAPAAKSKLTDALARMSRGKEKDRGKAPIEEMAEALRRPVHLDRPIVKEQPVKRQLVANEADAMTVFGARGQTPPRERPRFVGAAMALVLLVVLAVVAIWSTYFMNDVASGWFGLGGDPEIAEVEEPAPVIVPETLTPSTATEPAPFGQTPTEESAAAPTEETVLPSVPLPGIEVTALQPEPEETAPSAPEAPADEVEIAALPAPVAEVPSAGPDAPQGTPELAAAEAPATETPGVDAAVAPPAAPEEPVSETAAASPLDDGPSPDIATIAPALPDASGSAGGAETSAPTDGGAAPDPLEIVRLEQPPDAEAVPRAEVSAPAPTRVPPPTEEQAAAIYDRTGISVLAPPAIDSPGIDRLDGTVLSSADVALANPETRGLAAGEDLVTSDAVPTFGMPPFPLTTEFDLDDRGFVRATEDGAVTPQGTLVISGEPPVVPPPRPGTEPPQDDTELRDQPPATEETGPDTSVAEAPDSPLSAEEMAALDPETVPDLAPLLNETDLAEADERALLGGLTFDELAEIRPTLRPGSLDTAADDAASAATDAATEPDAATDPDGATETAADASAADPAPTAEDTVSVDPLIDFADVVPPLRPGTERPAPGDETTDTASVDSASLAGTLVNEPEAEPETETSQSFEGATELAVDASVAPTTRPAGFASIVQAALEEAAAAPPPPDDTPEPANDPTPAVTVPLRVPDIPTSAGVAATATDENALRLNRVNLIGVYGSASNRRALVRLASGRYVKVQVGDTVDGGRVAAIGDGELVYVKGSRTITLTMPSG